MWTWFLVTALASPVDEADTWIARTAAAHPSVVAPQLRADAARARAQTAGRWPDPVAMVQYTGPFSTGWIGDHPMAGIDARLTQRLQPPRWSRTQKGAADALEAVQQASAEVARHALAGRLGHAWWRLAGLSAQAEVLTHLREDAALARDSVEARYAVGQADDATLLRLEQFLDRVDQQLDDVARLTQSTRATLRGLAAAPLPFDPVLPRHPAADPGQHPADDAPPVDRARAQATATAAQADAVATHRAPPVDLWVGVRGRTFQSATDPGVDLFTVGASIPIPLSRIARGNQEVAAWNAESRAAEAEARAQAEGIQGQADALRAAWQQGIDTVDRLDATRLPRADALLQAVQSAFESGRASGLDLHEAQRERLMLSLERVQAVTATWIARAELAALLGEDPTAEVTP